MTSAIPPVVEHRGYPYLPNFWDYYTQLPDLYHRFALSTDAGVEMLHQLRPLTGVRDEALATYGVIYGPAAIDWLLEHQSPVIEWGNRIYLRTED